MIFPREYRLAAYRRLREYVDLLSPSFKDLPDSLRSAKILMTSEEFIAGTLATSIFVFIASFFLMFILLIFLGYSLNLIVFLTALTGAFILSIMAFMGFAFYPTYKINSRKQNIEGDLPYAVTHMATIAGTGIPPNKIFELMSKFDEYEEISEECKDIVRNTNVFGYNINTSLKEIALKCPSKKFADLLWGIISIIRSGGVIRDYLNEEAKAMLEEHRRIEKDYIETLSMLSEIYTTMFVAAPILFIVMLAIMSIIGGLNLPIGGKGLLELTIYLVIPAMSVLFILLLDSSKPKEVV